MTAFSQLKAVKAKIGEVETAVIDRYLSFMDLQSQTGCPLDMDQSTYKSLLSEISKQFREFIGMNSLLIHLTNVGNDLQESIDASEKRNGNENEMKLVGAG